MNKGGREGIRWLPTLFLREGPDRDAPPTKEIIHIYEGGVWPSDDKEKGGDEHGG